MVFVISILMQTFGQVFTVFSNFIFHALIKDSPQSRLGYFINLVGNASAVLAVSYLAASYRYYNWKNAHQAAVTNNRESKLSAFRPGEILSKILTCFLAFVTLPS
jgi:hypothetical protein